MTSDDRRYRGRWYYWWMLVVAFLLLLPLLIPGAYRVTREVDVSTGMKREQVQVLGVTIKSKISDTRFSRLVKGGGEVNNATSWRTESVLHGLPFLRRRPSAHFVHHGSFQSLDSLMNAFVVADTDDSRKQELAQQALLHLHKGATFTIAFDRNDNIELLAE